MDNTVVIRPQFYNMHGSNYGKLIIDCQSHSNIIISDETCEEKNKEYIINNHHFIRSVARLTDIYINVNSLLTCESFAVDSECLYMVFPFSKIIFKFNGVEIYIMVEKDSLIFSAVLASMYAVWLAFCRLSDKIWLANVLAHSENSSKPSIEILTKTLQGLWSTKQFNLADFDIRHIPYIKDVFKNCTYELLEDNAHLLDKEQIISIIEELDEDQGERKAMLIQAAGLKDDDSRRFEL